MTDPTTPWQKARGLQALVHDAVDATADLVDLGHESTMRSIRAVVGDRGPLRAGVDRVDGVRRGVTRGVLTAIKAINRGVEAASSVAYQAADGLERRDTAGPPDSTRGGLADAAVGVLNGGVGDRLSARRNALEQPMVLRIENREEPPGPRVVLFVHGLAMTDRSWTPRFDTEGTETRDSFGSRLQRELGMTPAYLRYNTGRPVADNGRDLADALERFVASHPVPIDDLVLVGHSMGGLVLRSAGHAGLVAGHAWTARARQVVCLGSPHRGAPLAKLHGGLGRTLGAVDLPATQILARLLGGLSAGIHDLEHGVDRDGGHLAWLPCRHLFVAATITDDPAHWAGHLAGDLLVRTTSAEGPRSDTGPVSIETRRLGGVRHQQLTRHPAVYELLRDACRPV